MASEQGLQSRGVAILMDSVSTAHRYEIIPPRRFIPLNVREIWRFRDLLYILAWRDLKVRYKQTLLGAAWAVFQPLLAMSIFSLFFGRLAKIPSEGVPYPIFVYSGLLLWNCFSGALSNASQSLIDGERIIKKVYFPRVILPLAATATSAVDFLVAYIVLLCLMIYYHVTPSLLGILSAPVLLAASLVAALGPGLFLSSLNAKFRDVRYVLPFFMQILFFLTPVIYPPTFVPEKFAQLLYLNPMAAIITVARSLMLRAPGPEVSELGMSLTILVLLVISGTFYFRRNEQFFADIL